jgi:hypothetical protein
MSRKPVTRPDPPEHTPEEHLPGARNPRNNPHSQLDGSPVQQNAPEQAEIEQQQDQQPVDPVPLIHQAANPSRGTREQKNG